MRKKVFILILISLLFTSFIFTSCKKEDELEEPEMSIDATKNYMKAPFTVDFTNTSVANGHEFQSFEWDFDDGETSTEENPSHEFTEPGLYMVDLLATDQAGDKFGTTKRITAYGNITAWEPNHFTIFDDALSNIEDTISIYFNVRDSDGNIFDYTGSEIFVVEDDVTSESNNIEFQIHDYQLPLTSGSVTLEIYKYEGGQTVDPDSDELIWGHTVNTSDVVPINDEGPYLPNYKASGTEFNLTINWIEE